MAFIDGKLTQVTKGPCDLPPIVKTSVNAVTRSESRRKSSLTSEDLPPPSPHFFETTRLLNNAAPNKGNQTPVRLPSVRQNGRGKRQSTLRGSLPYIGENCEDFPGDKPEMIERCLPSDGEDHSKPTPVATFAPSLPMRYRPPKSLLTIARGPQPANLNFLTQSFDQPNDSDPLANSAKESNIRTMAKLGQSENSLNTATSDVVSKSPPDASLHIKPRAVRLKNQLARSVNGEGDMSPNSTWGLAARMGRPSLSSAYSTPALNRLSSVSSKITRPLSSNSNDIYGGQQDNTVYTRFGLASHAITERHEQEVQRYLNAYARGSLPKIPKDYAEDFPQGLARDKAVFLDAVADRISTQKSSPATAPTQGDSKKARNQEHAIMELVQTEANYIKVLEMMMDVHVAVFLELNKPLAETYRSNRNSLHRHRRRRDSLYDRIKSTHRRRIRSHTELNLSSRASTSNLYNGPSSETSSFKNFGSTNSISSVSAAHALQMIPDVSDVFGNLGHVYRANVTFWEACFEPCFSSSISSTKTIFTVAKLKAPFMKFETYFEPYVEYLRECYSIIEYVKVLEGRNRLFATYSEWTTYNNTLHLRESLTSLLRKPFQRLLQYALLLQRIKDETCDPQEIEDLDEMLSAVNTFVKEIENGIPEQEAKIELEKFLERIERYSYLKSLPDGLHSCADGLDELKARLRQPVTVGCKTKYRKPLAELSAKVQFSNGKVKQKVCILLTDQILICKQIRLSNALDVCRPPISLICAQIISKPKHGSWSIVEKSELNLTKEVYKIFADVGPLKDWADKVRKAKSALDMVPKVPGSLAQSSSWCSSETRTTQPSIKSSPQREGAVLKARTLPPSTGRFGSSELLPPALVRRPTATLLPEQPNPSKLTATNRSHTLSRDSDYEPRIVRRGGRAYSSSGSTSDNTGGQLTDSTSSRNTSPKSNGGPTRLRREKANDEIDDLCRSDFPATAGGSATARNRKRKGMTKVV